MKGKAANGQAGRRFRTLPNESDRTRRAGAGLNYRHAFHAGNFADLVKHAILLELLARREAHGSLTVFDTHAGAGIYDLNGEAAQRSGEAAAGITRLMADVHAPAAFDRLKTAVSAANPGEELRVYPGSPALALGALRRRDRYIGCELSRDDHASLTQLISRYSAGQHPTAEALNRDGFAEAAKLAPPRNIGPTLILVDPPFEGGDDYARIVELAGILRYQDYAGLAVWTPLKDLETFDALLRNLEALARPAIQVAEARLRSLDDPTRMNGCAMILINLPDVSAEAQAICGWTAAMLGEPGGEGRVSLL